MLSSTFSQPVRNVAVQDFKKANDGTFWMAFEDFVLHYRSVCLGISGHLLDLLGKFSLVSPENPWKSLTLLRDCEVNWCVCVCLIVFVCVLDGVYIYMYILYGGFLKWSVSPVVIHFDRIFHYKPSILGYPMAPPLIEPPHKAESSWEVHLPCLRRRVETRHGDFWMAGGNCRRGRALPEGDFTNPSRLPPHNIEYPHMNSCSSDLVDYLLVIKRDRWICHLNIHSWLPEGIDFGVPNIEEYYLIYTTGGWDQYWGSFMRNYRFSAGRCFSARGLLQ